MTFDPSVPHDPSDFARTPLTLAVFGVLAGYCIAYAIGLARWRAGVMSTPLTHDVRAAA